MSVKKCLNTETVPSVEKCNGSVIFLHGSSGTSVRSVIQECLGDDLSFRHLQIHYPFAPLRPYTLNGGAIQRAWFDRITLNQSSPEQLESIEESASILNQLIEEEIKSGIPINRIFFGGHSMGGGMSLHIGLRYHPDLAGIFCLSSFLNDGSKVYEDLEKRKNSRYPKVFMAHGSEDDDVFPEWGKVTRRKLEELSIHPTYHVLEGTKHDVTKEELLLLKEWISNILEEEE